VTAKTAFSPFQSYIVKSPDPAYKGMSARQEFLNGRANIYALAKDATPEEVAAREQELAWFLNAGYTVTEAQLLQPKAE